jgi:hypothetical protein
MKEERLAAFRCDRAETRGADETDVRRSMELLSAQMVIYPNAIVDHHFDELMFFLIRCAELRIIHFSVAFGVIV